MYLFIVRYAQNAFLCQGLGLVKRMSQVRAKFCRNKHFPYLSVGQQKLVSCSAGLSSSAGWGFIVHPSIRSSWWSSCPLITAFFVARVVVLVRHTVGSGVRGEWGGRKHLEKWTAVKALEHYGLLPHLVALPQNWPHVWS